MSIRYSQPFWVSILAFCLVSPLALAEPAEDTARAEAAYRTGDMVKAMTLWRQAANQNYAVAQARLGEVLDVAEQDEEAVSWFRKAAEQGNAAGEFGLGHMYASGEGIEKDIGKALYWIRRAADQDYLLAVEMLSRAYQIGDLGLSVDMQQSKLWENRGSAIKNSADAAAKTIEKTEQGQGK